MTSAHRRAGWRLTVAAGEGFRNWRSGRWLTAIATTFVIGVLSIPTVIDGVWIDRLLADERAWVSAGGRTLVVTNDEGGGIPRVDCESLTHIEGVRASASLTRMPERTGTVSAPDANIPLVAAGEGIWGLLGVAPVDGVIVPVDIAQDLRLQAGSPLVLTPTSAGGPAGSGSPAREASSVGAVVDTSVLGEQFEYALLLPTSATGNASTCMISYAPGYETSIRQVIPTLLGDGTHDAVLADRLVSGTYGRDFSAEYERRGLRLASWFGGGAISLLWLLIVWIRRGRDGLYATLGADFAARAVIRGSEGVVLIGTSALAAVVVVGLITPLALQAPSALVADLLRHLAITSGVAIIGVCASVFLPLRSPLASLKDR